MSSERIPPVLADDGGAPPPPRRYALFGEPIERSLSPRIHAAFAAQRRIALRYELLPASTGTFAERLAAFAAEGGAGANVTAPLKALAAALCERLEPAAQRSGVANTLTLIPGGGWAGDNTDGAGFIADVCLRLRHDVRGRRVLLLGAGGAIAGIVPALLDAGAGDLVIANRHPERAEALALRIGEPARVHSAYWQDLDEAGEFDLVVNGTSAGHRGEDIALPMGLLAPRAMAYDLNYGTAAVGFLAWARAAGATDVHDGLGMLVDQAAVAFAHWHGVEPDADAVLASLRVDLP
ncbi:MAG: shikimate dehydrogenase [Xanthomonadales bacterium]|nr:shikimate dehydrogenase [Xanthomonadales bacterium]